MRCRMVKRWGRGGDAINGDLSNKGLALDNCGAGGLLVYFVGAFRHVCQLRLLVTRWFGNSVGGVQEDPATNFWSVVGSVARWALMLYTCVSGSAYSS